jgi:hypothetical protein
MPLLDHFHPPLHGPRRWEGFHHAWATTIATQLNRDVLPEDYFAEPEICVGPEMEVESGAGDPAWPRPTISIEVDFVRPPAYEIRINQHLSGPTLKGVIELVSPANKDRAGRRRTFAARCAGYLQHGIGVVVVDIVTSCSASLHEELFDVLEVKNEWNKEHSPTGLAVFAYRAVTLRNNPRIEVWLEPLTLGGILPVSPLWLAIDLCVPVRLEESYMETCRSLRISA